MVVPRDLTGKIRQARRHVAEAEERVSAQRKLIERMVEHGDRAQIISTAKKVLDTFEKTLEAMRQHLSLEENERRDASRRR